MEKFYEDPLMFFEENFESDQEIVYIDYSDDESELENSEIFANKKGHSKYIAVKSLYEEFYTGLTFTDERFRFLEEIPKDKEEIEDIDYSETESNFSISALFQT